MIYSSSSESSGDDVGTSGDSRTEANGRRDHSEGVQLVRTGGETDNVAQRHRDDRKGEGVDIPEDKRKLTYVPTPSTSSIPTEKPNSGSVGFQLLRWLGWNKGEGLGKSSQGKVEPLKTEILNSNERNMKNQEQIHPMIEVSNWMKMAFSEEYGRFPVLYLSGPTGSGKSTTAEVLCREQHYEFIDYTPELFHDDLWKEEDPDSTQLIRFLLKRHAGFSGDSKRSLLFISELPDECYNDPSNFQAELSEALYQIRHPVIFCLSNDIAFRKLNPDRIFTKTFNLENNISTITFNPVAEMFMKKAISRAARILELSLSEKKLEVIGEEAHGDLRLALKMMQMQNSVGRNTGGQPEVTTTDQPSCTKPSTCFPEGPTGSRILNPAVGVLREATPLYLKYKKAEGRVQNFMNVTKTKFEKAAQKLMNEEEKPSTSAAAIDDSTGESMAHLTSLIQRVLQQNEDIIRRIDRIEKNVGALLPSKQSPAAYQ